MPCSMNLLQLSRYVNCFLLVSIIGFALVASDAAAENDVECLQGIKSSLIDPSDMLSSWDFRNTSSGSICEFQGVDCWNSSESRVLNLELHNMNLAGRIPESLKNCLSLTGLDLSGNKLYGPIPDQICTWLPYLTFLNLSDNLLSGPLPTELANCSFLNVLALSNNRLSGTIPYELSTLQRLRRLSVANNHLEGVIPASFSQFNKSNFAGNRGLCGEPLGKCSKSKKKVAVILAAGVSGAAGSLLLTLVLWRMHIIWAFLELLVLFPNLKAMTLTPFRLILFSWSRH